MAFDQHFFSQPMFNLAKMIQFLMANTFIFHKQWSIFTVPRLLPACINSPIVPCDTPMQNNKSFCQYGIIKIIAELPTILENLKHILQSDGGDDFVKNLNYDELIRLKEFLIFASSVAKITSATKTIPSNLIDFIKTVSFLKKSTDCHSNIFDIIISNCADRQRLPVSQVRNYKLKYNRDEFINTIIKFYWRKNQFGDNARNAILKDFSTHLVERKAVKARDYLLKILDDSAEQTFDKKISKMRSLKVKTGDLPLESKRARDLFLFGIMKHIDSESFENDSMELWFETVIIFICDQLYNDLLSAFVPEKTQIHDVFKHLIMNGVALPL